VASGSATLQAKGRFDRTLIERHRQRLLERAVDSPDQVIDVIDRLKQLAVDALASLKEDCSPTLRLRAISVARECLKDSATLEIAAVIDRVSPVLSRITAEQLLSMIPPAEDEIEAAKRAGEAADASDPAKLKAAVLSELREAVRHRTIGIVAVVPRGDAIDPLA